MIHPLTTNYLQQKILYTELTAVFSLIWVIFLIMKLMRPTEFSVIVKRPFVYYRMYSGRAGRHFEDFKMTGLFALILLTFLTVNYLSGATTLSGNLQILIPVSLLFVFNFIAGKLFALWKKNFNHVHFIKWIYGIHAAFIASFLFFPIIFVNPDTPVKRILILAIIIYHYAKYLRTLYKIQVELGIKAFHIILYLCVSEIIPVSVLIWSLRHHL